MTGASIFLTLLLVWLSRCLHQTRANVDGDDDGTDAGVVNDFTANNGTRLIESPSRRARALVFPRASQLLLIFGLGTPLQLDRESVILGYFAKIVYDMPANATDFTEPGIYYSRQQKSRWSIYRMLEKAAGLYGFGGKACVMKAICEAASTPFDDRHSLLGQLLQVLFKHGWRDGKNCLLRTICELAETPFGRTRGQDVLEEVIHLILTPTEDLPGTANSTHRSVDELYREAERLGRSGGDCILAYPDCIESPLESFTEIAFP
ncbi:uncharacterized protein LOC143210356 isoform X1 [Lasioglossum baleicum]|uniref:uncharacterized protein LOC143210356 isoform X1 n=1 Tax=Lasioglossum baleicum TaxID=434251 RepID=UPI003FCC6A7F